MVSRLLENDEAAYGILTGFAGTGKSFLVKVIADLHGNPIILSPTGKGAVRIKELTGLEAMTVHRYLYKPEENPKTGETIWIPKPLHEIKVPRNRLVVVDESSMVGDRLWNDLWVVSKHLNLRVLLVGDIFQLAPVRPETQDFSCLTSLKTEHRVELNEVVRQALDNPILRALMLIRQSEAGTMEALNMLDSVSDTKLVPSFLAMDAKSRAIISWRNKTRQALNINIRKALGYEPDTLVDGEPMLVMNNAYDLDRFNGEIVGFGGWVTAPGEERAVRDAHKNISAMLTYGVARVEGKDVLLSPEEVFGQVNGIGPRIITKWGRGYAMTVFKYTASMAPPHLSANLGYALTAHKAQGGEWDDVVVVIEPGRKLLTYEGRRWIYTGLSRTRKRACICFMDSLDSL